MIANDDCLLIFSFYQPTTRWRVIARILQQNPNITSYRLPKGQNCQDRKTQHSTPEGVVHFLGNNRISSCHMMGPVQMFYNSMLGIHRLNIKNQGNVSHMRIVLHVYWWKMVSSLYTIFRLPLVKLMLVVSSWTIVQILTILMS